jgi:hypothetical protein
MLRLHADRFVLCMNRIAQIELLTRQDPRFIYSIPREVEETGSRLEDLCQQLEALQLAYSARSAKRLRDGFKSRANDLGERVRDLALRLKDELEQSVCFRITSEQSQLYTDSLKDWATVVERFGCAFDVEEAGKCFALDRPTASVFHLMKIAERGVLELQCFLDKPDPKAHFGSVLSKLETLHRKTDFKDIPDRLKPHRDFLIGILAQLHAVKDSWRNKVCHVDEKIIPIDEFTPEMATGIYSATLLLMNKLAEGLPANTLPHFAPNTGL